MRLQDWHCTNKYNKIMNLLPLIHRPRKSQHFACPLNGTMFKTEQFRTSINKSQISTLSHASPDIEPRSKLFSTKTQQKLQVAALQQPITGRHTQHRKMDRVKQYQTIDSIKSKLEEVLTSNKKQVKSSAKKESEFIFPEVEVLPLHLIEHYQDITNFKIKVTLQPYFKMFFASHISYKSAELNKLMQKYVPLMKEYNMLDQQFSKQKWPQQFWQIKNTQELLCTIGRYDKNTQYWTKYVLVLLSLYCIPDKTVRSTSLDNLILLINKKISSKHQDYKSNSAFLLLKEDGTPIQDFIDIEFSTKKLYLVHQTQPASHNQVHEAFLAMTKRYKEQVKKAGFKNRIKSHFRNEIVPNKCDEQNFSVNYKLNYAQYVKQKNMALNRAVRLLELKKQKSKNNLTALSTSIPVPPIRPKSKQRLWREQNVEDIESPIDTNTSDLFHFQISLGRKSLQAEAVEQFKKYHELSKSINPQINEDQIYLGVLQNNHPILRGMAQSKYHSMKLPKIFSILLRKNLQGQYSQTTPMKWYSFVQFFVVCSKNTQKLIELEDCYQIVRNFVQDYLQIKDQDYFRQQLAAKIFRMIEGDKLSASLVEEVVWSWLCQNGFVKHDAVQKELLWTFAQRSKTFYLLMVSMIFATFKTSPLDLAHQLLL